MYSKKTLTTIPKHVGIICDGNGRWGKLKGLLRTAGHVKGMDVVKDISYVCAEEGVKFLTMFAFSTENWIRPKNEVDFLMNLFIKFFREWRNEANEKNIKINHIGNLDGLSEELKKEIEITTKLTSNNNKMIFNIALNYGGRDEIVYAINSILKKIKNNTLKVEEIDEKIINEHLYTSNQADLDLLIRTGDEKRLSNFLLWQASNAVISSVADLWPDFGREQLWDCFDYYQKYRLKK